MGVVGLSSEAERQLRVGRLARCTGEERQGLLALEPSTLTSSCLPRYKEKPLILSSNTPEDAPINLKIFKSWKQHDKYSVEFPFSLMKSPFSVHPTHPRSEPLSSL